MTVYGLSYQYDQEGLHELRHRELKRKLEVVKAVDHKDFMSRADAATSASNECTLTMKEDELIRKRPNGTFVMFKSNFDFLEKPKGYLESDEFLNAVAPVEESKKAQVQVQY